MQDIPEIVREIGRQQGANVFYRTCYDSLKRLQDVVAQAYDDLRHIPQHDIHDASSGWISARVIAEELQSSIDRLIDREYDAYLSFEELYYPKS